ncbi:MAG: 50S ribosomal protein L6 [archaeon]|nr:50S ribosomal protein L6 [archaeon]
MKKIFSESISVPEGIQCELKDNKIICKKDSTELSKYIKIPKIEVKLKDNAITFECKSGNKKDYKIIKSLIAHMKNFFEGFNKKFVYKLESANVHFPMTLKVEGHRLVINNFLGEKKPRHAEIMHGVNVEIKGSKITITSSDKEAAGQTAANFEKATKIRNRDRRIFQDGIYITEKPGVSHE